MSEYFRQVSISKLC